MPNVQVNSEVISFERYRADKQTHSHGEPTALPGPLKWSITIVED